MQAPATRNGAPATDEQARTLRTLDPVLAAQRLAAAAPGDAARLLGLLNTLRVRDILAHLDETDRERILSAAPSYLREQWATDARFEEGTVGSLMEPAVALFRPETPVAEAIETLPRAPLEAAAMSGAGHAKVMSFAVFPAVLPNLSSVSLYVWEANVRTSTVLGIVGAGGIGIEIKAAIDLLDFQRLFTLTVAVLIMVTLIDQLSAWIRRRLV